MDYAFLEKCFNGRKMGLLKRKLNREEIDAYKANFMQPGKKSYACIWGVYFTLFELNSYNEHVAVYTL